VRKMSVKKDGKYKAVFKHILIKNIIMKYIKLKSLLLFTI
jgi:hypothetical protein